MAITIEEIVSSTDEYWKMTFDGASNALGHGIGAILVSPGGEHYPFTSILNFDCTNNMTEYESCIIGLRAAIEHKVKALKVEENQMADALATLASAYKVNEYSSMVSITMQTYEYPPHCYSIENEEDENPWYRDILKYIKYQSYPEQATENERRTIRRLAARYVLDGEILYKKSHDQIYRDKLHTPPHPLHVMIFPWPFSMWGMDVIGQITPKASNGHRFILVAIYYFTKWVEAASYANVTQLTVCKFLKREIIYRYGLPERIITDNTLNLNNKMMGDWHDKLPFALFAYQTSVRTSTGATPFSLAYGMESVLPIKVEIPSLRVLSEVKLDEAEWMQARYNQLNLIEEKRLKAICHGQMYQKRMIRAHNKKVHPREFQEEDLVLRKILPIQKDFRGKWMPNWEGPYVVNKAFSGGALILTKIDGLELPNPVNVDADKKYFA
ncbi:uncharacterized protein LOC120122746 [Hibiscus syriacus]|uniref:uncharacterized protein LOC120122746 n=1 Tax=Hibiscus syriacus TaxID=106335 RepID=UPI00192384BE|nr:uncharacterized protein LOC120122746 [Hibiscus syriacus]